MYLENKYISVIIPTYNREKTIYRSIMSVLNQTHKKLELIVVDDCSIDETEKIVRSIKDERIRYVKLDKNSGANFARNKGIELAKYELVAFQDSDDEWHKDKLDKQLYFLFKNDYEMIGGSYNQYINNKFNKIIPSIEIKGNYLELLLKQNFLSTQTLLGYKYIYQNERFDEKLPRLQDWDFVIRVCKKYRVGFLKEVLVDVYMQDDSISKDDHKYIKAIKKILYKYRVDFSNNEKSIKYRKLYLILLKNKKVNNKYLKLALRYDASLINKIMYIFMLLKLEKILRILYLIKNRRKIK